MGALSWLGWKSLWAIMAMHQSPVRDVHLFWLFAIAAILVMTLLTTALPSMFPNYPH